MASLAASGGAQLMDLLTAASAERQQAEDAGSPPPEEEDELDGYADSCGSRSEDGYSGSERRSSSEYLAGSAKKRRKQEHPVKIADDLSREGEEGEATAETEERPPTPASSEMQLRCPYCPQTFPGAAEFKFHIEVDHIRRGLSEVPGAGESMIFGRELPLNLSAPQRREQMQTPPHNKHRVDSGRSEKALFPAALPIPPSFQDKFPIPSFLQFGPTPFLLPFLSQPIGGSPLIPPSGEPPVKIFNPEAYCEICNKEFCNKYFLKTHKANKHGIYSDPVSCTMGLNSSVASANVSSTHPSAPQTSFSHQMFHGNLPGTTKHPQPDGASTHSAVPTPGGLSSATHSSARNGGSLVMNPCAIRQPLPQSAAVVSHDSPSAESGDSGRPSSEADVARSSATDTYCELCQKEFCDTYYLRRHRMKIHGIEPPGRTPIYQPPIQEERKSGKQVQDNIDYQGQHEAISGREQADPYDTRELGDPAEKPISFQSSVDEFNDERDGLRAYTGETDEKIQPLDSATPDPSLQTGVKYTDAVCKICCKEFSSRDHLALHMHAEHGSDLRPHENGGNFDTEVVPSSTQEQPLDNPSEDNSKLNECKQCSRLFQSEYLLQMHRFYVHGSVQENGHQASRPPVAPDPDSFISDKKESEHFSGELQKLQGMVKGLNERKTKALVSCHLCNKKIENKFNSLQAHLMHEHGVFQTRENLKIPKPPVSGALLPGPRDCKGSVSPPMQASDTFCNVCNMDFYANFFLQQHMQTAHGIDPPSLSDTAFLARIRQEVECQKRPERPKPASTSRSYCEICNKELCNKYFMKTHMIKMHGINMENHQMQGGVKCEVCQKELCSLYFLKVHKQNTHGIYDPEDDKALLSTDAEIKDEPGLEICSVCSGKFKTAKLLESHMQSEHGAPKEPKSKSKSSKPPVASLGTTCSLCGCSLPDLLSLRIHLMQVHAVHEHKTEGDAQASDEAAKDSRLPDTLLHHAFGAFGRPLAPFLNHERMLNLLPVEETAGQRLLTSETRCDSLQLQAPAEHSSQPKSDLADAETQDRTLGLSDAPGAPHPIPEVSALPLPARCYRCKPCRLRFPQRHHYLSHWHQKHGHNRLPYAASLLRGYLNHNFKCTRCGFSSRLRRLVRRHVRRHHRRSPCGEQVPCLYALPIPDAGQKENGYSMQSFLMMAKDADEAEKLVAPAYVVLPVFREVRGPTELKFVLKPM